MSRKFVTGALFGALIAVGTLSATSAVAGNGPGGIFNLGRTNTVNATSTLTGSASGASLSIVNRSSRAAATGLSIVTGANRAPMRVTSKVQVLNLNASLLGGKPASAFLPVAGTAANSSKLQGKTAADFLAATGTAVNSSKLQGKTAADFLAATGTAVNAAALQGMTPADFLAAEGTAADSSKLGGVSAAEYIRRCDPQGSGIYQGAVAAKAAIDGSAAAASYSSDGVLSSWVCTGQSAEVVRRSAGVYDVTFGDEIVTIGGNQFIGFPIFATPEVPMVSAATAGTTAAVEGPYQCAFSPPPFRVCFTVTLVDGTGTPADGRFNLALL
jgi:hypothetical protein